MCELRLHGLAGVSWWLWLGGDSQVHADWAVQSMPWIQREESMSTLDNSTWGVQCREQKPAPCPCPEFPSREHLQLCVNSLNREFKINFMLPMSRGDLEAAAKMADLRLPAIAGMLRAYLPPKTKVNVVFLDGHREVRLV